MPDRNILVWHSLVCPPGGQDEAGQEAAKQYFDLLFCLEALFACIALHLRSNFGPR